MSHPDLHELESDQRFVNQSPPTWARMVCGLLLTALVIFGAATPGGQAADRASQISTQEAIPDHQLQARLIAVGIPGIGGLRQVGVFHDGGAIPNNPDFAAETEPGHVLAANRLLVSSNSNFGAPLGIPSQSAGSVLSIDPDRGEVLEIPANFAIKDGQAQTLNGNVIIYSAQSPAFLNRIHNPTAATAMQPGAANPRYISINNAFGRPWFANAPEGISGVGTNTVIDPTGRPLANPPSVTAGGVFAGSMTNRPQQIMPGNLSQAALGTAFMGISPDDTGFAVFAVASSDGSIAQVHVRDGVDGLLPAGTLSPIETDFESDNGMQNGGIIGLAFNWVPKPILYATDTATDQILAVHLGDDGQLFNSTLVEKFSSPLLHTPIDLAPALPEVANPRFSSHTTLAGGSDLYVANRGNGTLLRMNQTGDITAVAQIILPEVGPIGADRLQGMAVSGDGQRIWLAVSGTHPQYPSQPGYIIEVDAFNIHGSLALQRAYGVGSLGFDPELIAAGHAAFTREFTPEDGLGPFFNQTSCAACHSQPTIGGAGEGADSMGVRVGFLDTGSNLYDPLIGQGGPVVQFHSINEFGVDVPDSGGVPDTANVVSMRTAPALYGLDLIDQIPEEAILAQAVDKGDGVHGRVNVVTNADGAEVIGRYGWKADVGSLDEMIGIALASEMGITNPLAGEPVRVVNGQTVVELEDDGSLITAIRAFIASLAFPQIDEEVGP